MVIYNKTLSLLLAETQANSVDLDSERRTLNHIKKVIDNRLEDVNRFIEEDLERKQKQIMK